jgi:predicted phage tail protein
LAVTAVDSARNESRREPVVVKVPDWKAPERVSFLNAKALPHGEVRLTWGESPSLDVVRYELSRFEGEKNEQLLGRFAKAKHTWIDSSAQAGKTYTYAVVALDSSGNKGEPRVTKFLAHDRIPPAAPRDLLAQVTARGVRISWGRVIASDLAGFNVYRCTIPTGVFEKINTVPVKKREFLDLTGKKNLWYKVRAVDTSGNESAWKKAVQAR